MNGLIGPNPTIDLFVNLCQFGRGQWSGTGKVEAQPFRLNQRTALLHLCPQQVSQGFVQQMGGTVVAYRIFTALLNHIGLYSIAHAQVALAHFSIVNDQAFEGTARILYMKDTNQPANVALIAYLTTAFSIKWGCIQHQQGPLRGTDTLNLNTIDD